MIAARHTDKAKRLCKTCAKAKAERWCIHYVDEITGEPARLDEARAECRGSEWESAAWRHIDTAPKINAGPSDIIETAKATIHKDPWDKINKTYE